MSEGYTNVPDSGLDLPDPNVAQTVRQLGISFRVVGSVMQSLMIQLNRGQYLYSESGSLSWMTDGVKMETNLGGKGLGGLLSRVVTGESLFVVNFSAERDQQLVTFSSDFPGKIIPIHLAQGQSMIAQKDALLVAEKSVTMSVALQKRLGAGIFGGEGFILELLLDALRREGGDAVGADEAAGHDKPAQFVASHQGPIQRGFRFETPAGLVDGDGVGHLVFALLFEPIDRLPRVVFGPALVVGVVHEAGQPPQFHVFLSSPVDEGRRPHGALNSSGVFEQRRVVGPGVQLLQGGVAGEGHQVISVVRGGTRSGLNCRLPRGRCEAGR